MPRAKAKTPAPPTTTYACSCGRSFKNRQGLAGHHRSTGHGDNAGADIRALTNIEQLKEREERNLLQHELAAAKSREFLERLRVIANTPAKLAGENIRQVGGAQQEAPKTLTAAGSHGGA